jgi:protein-L-isoaspartate O-methyltransferase
MSSALNTSLDSPASLVPLHVYSELGHDSGLVGQMTERVQLVRSWGIQPGESVLEVGCGQGDATIALAVAVGAEGRVVALDPASLDYGTVICCDVARSTT